MNPIKWILFFGLTILLWSLLLAIWSRVIPKNRKFPRGLMLLLLIPAGTVTSHIICGCTPVDIFRSFLNFSEGSLVLKLLGLIVYSFMWIIWVAPLGILGIAWLRVRK